MSEATTIIEQKDIEQLMNLSSEEMESVLIDLLYGYLYKMPIKSMNKNQLDLFLLMTLEDHCQADGLDSLSEDEELFFRVNETYSALLRIHAPKTAEALKKFIDMLPDETFTNRVIPDWKEWFMNEVIRERIQEVDSIISSYPDGLMRDLYAAYIKNNIDFARDILEV